MTTFSHLHLHCLQFSHKSLIACKYSVWTCESFGSFGGPSGQMWNCVFYAEPPPVCPAQFKDATAKLYLSAVINTNEILGMRRRETAEPASVSHTAWEGSGHV